MADLTWTPDAPTQPGRYWSGTHKDHYPDRKWPVEILELVLLEDGLLVDKFTRLQVNRFHPAQMWAGPIVSDESIPTINFDMVSH